ncbi:MAG: riboflavin biosynthesis protein RibF [Planctomycetota bacterium]
MIVSLERAGLPAPPAGGSVVSVGVFDGVHLGHQAILAENVAQSAALGAAATVVTFRHHPKGVLLGRAPRTLTSLEHRLELFRRAGISHTVALTFDEDLKNVPADSFAREFLGSRLGARRFVLGFDSKFGRGREGTPERLREWGLDVVVVTKVLVSDRPVSSTAIREAVELGDLDGAARMLGRPVAVYGDVVAGDGRGRSIGFPTANLDLHHELHPPPGVYACRARIVRGGPADLAEQGRRFPAVTNVGFRPTFTKSMEASAGAPLVEVHLLDFEGDLYGRHLELEFHAFLRAERRFPDLDSLRAAIAQDVERSRALLR